MDYLLLVGVPGAEYWLFRVILWVLETYWKRAPKVS